MAQLKDYRDEQLAKLAEIKARGIDPYPAHSHRTQSIGSVVVQPDNHPDNLWLAGRLLAQRQHGQLEFWDLADQSGQIQLMIRRPDLVADYDDNCLAGDDLRLLTRGDFIEARGQPGHSQKGELSLMVDRLRLLVKALRPLPEQLTDLQTKRRQRYLDLAINPAVRQRYIRRSLFWQAVRDFLNQAGFVEINTPVLEHTTGGAEARPFKTHMAALDQDFYLRISHELPLKKLLGGGLEKVYDIGPRFRNENYSDEHLPEHVAMEWYWAYADWHQGMELMEDFFRFVARKTFNRLEFDWRGRTINLADPWSKLDYADQIRRHYQGLDIYQTDLAAVNHHLATNKLVVEKVSLAAGIDKLWKNIRGQIAGPAWLINLPGFISPLSKNQVAQPQVAQRFQAVIAGSELCNGFSELNDPIEQLERFIDQQKQRQAGYQEAHMLDIDFIEMLEYGMPPACGIGVSERLFWSLEGVVARDGVVFAQTKPGIKATTRQIYPQLFSESGWLK